MNLERTKEIIQALADGIDPYTGEQFPPDSPYQRADTVRALYTILEAAEDKTRRIPAGPRQIDPDKPMAGGKWTEEEEQRLRDAYAAHKPITEIATDHGRTPGAISSRLVRLGLIEDTPANRSGQGNSPDPGPPQHRPDQPPPTPGNTAAGPAADIRPAAPPLPPSSSPAAPFNPDDCPF